MQIQSRTRMASFLMSMAVLCFSFFTRLSFLPVRIWDEARNANNAFSIYSGGHWLIPYYQGSPDMWNTKPPLLIWLQALDMHIFGVHEFSVRLPSVLAALATGMLLWFFCTWKLQKPWMGFLSATVLAFTPAYVMNHAGRTGDYDSLMVLFMTSSALSYFLFTEKKEGRYLMATWVLLTLAVFTKGIAGCTLLPGLLLYSLLYKKLGATVRNVSFYKGLVFFLVLIAGYYLLREQLNPGYLKAVYANELGGRYLETLEGHEYPFSYYFDNMTGFRYAYWIYFILPAFICGFIQKEKTVRRLTALNLLLSVSLFLIVSAGKTKLEWYELPVYPFLALQTGIMLYMMWQLLRSFLHSSISRAGVAALLLVIVFFVPAKKVYAEIFHYREKPWDDVPHRESYFIKGKMKQGADLSGYVFIYDGYNGQIDFYIEALRSRKVDVQLDSSFGAIKKGSRVVVCQEEMEKKLLDHFTVQKQEIYSGCTVYLVTSQP